MFSVAVGNYVKLVRNEDRLIDYMRSNGVMEEEWGRIHNMKHVGDTIQIGKMEITCMG